MRSPVWAGERPLSAGWRYSNGSLHAAYDVPMPNHTPLFSPVNGEVIARVTGVPNVPGGPGSPSNWVTIGHLVGGKWRTHYLQHLASVSVRPGQKVKVGQRVGSSGTSGNSSGPHLHWAYMHGRHGSSTRYSYLSNGGSSAIYPPTKGEDDMPLTQAEIDKIAKAVWSYKIKNTTTGSGTKTAHPAQWFLNSILSKVKR